MTTPNIEELIASLTQTNQFHESADICTADVIDVLQSQAERIAELEVIVASYGELDVEQAKHIACMESDLDTLRAQLEAIAAAEPVARAMSGKTNTGFVYVRVLADELTLGTELFTRPMPAQDVTDSHLHTLNVLKNVKQCLEAANKMGESSPICDTIWFTPHETLFDYIDAALSKYKGAK